MKSFRSNTVSYPILNMAKGMAKYVYASFLKEKTQPLLEDAVDLTKKSIVAGTVAIGGSQAVVAYQAISIPTRVLIGKAALGGSQGAFGAWATGGDKIDVLGGSLVGGVLGLANISSFGRYELSNITQNALSSAMGNIGGQMLSFYRDRKNK